MLSRNAQWLIVMMSLVTVTTVSAAPTVVNSDPKLAARPVSPASDLDTASRFPATARFAETSAKTSADSVSANEMGLLSGTHDSALADIAAEFLKPPADFTNPSALPPAARPLPAVPAALFMGLTGFLCVTLVRDRKFWLTATTFILWAGQIGIAALPQAASHLAGKRHIKQQACSNLAYTRELESSDRLRSDLEGTQYIGLLHHLEGIPAAKRNMILDSRFSILDEYRPVLRSSILRSRATAKVETAKGGVSSIEHPYNIRHTTYDIRYTNNIPNFAIAISRTCFIPAFICLVSEAQQHIIFSPAFIFAQLPRGPPLNL